MVLSKLTVLCPPLLLTTLPVLRFHLSRHTWLSHVPRHVLTAALVKEGGTRGVVRALRADMMEVALWTRLSCLPVQQVSVTAGEGGRVVVVVVVVVMVVVVVVDSNMMSALMMVTVRCYGNSSGDSGREM